MDRNQTDEPMIVIYDNQENCPKEAVRKIESNTGISEEDGFYKRFRKSLRRVCEVLTGKRNHGNTRTKVCHPLLVHTHHIKGAEVS